MNRTEYLSYLQSFMLKEIKMAKYNREDVMSILDTNATRLRLQQYNFTVEQYLEYINKSIRDHEFDSMPENSESDVAFHKYLYKISVPALFGLITLTGVIGNFLVIFIILSKNKMRTNVNILLLNLAFCDLIFLLVCVPFVTYHYAADNWVIGNVSCKLFQFLLYLTVYVTMYTLVAISVVRFLMIVYAHRSARLRTKRNTCILIGFIWVVMLIVNIPILFIYRVKKFHDTPDSAPYRYCGIENTDIGQQVFVSFFVLTYMLPLSFICTFYLLLLRFLRFNHRTSSVRSSTRSTNSSFRGRERTSYASRILLVVVGVFGVCWLPLHAHLLVVYFGHHRPASRYYEVFRVLCHCLAYSNSCMNPIIYNYVSQDFRKSFRGVLFSCLKCCSCRETSKVANPDMISTYDYRNENATCNGGASRSSSHKEKSMMVTIQHTSDVVAETDMEGDACEECEAECRSEENSEEDQQQ